MKNLIYYESNSLVGYRPQLFEEWVVGTKIMCDGVECVIKAVIPDTEEGGRICKELMRRSKVYQHNLALQREKAACRRLIGSNPDKAVDLLFNGLQNIMSR